MPRAKTTIKPFSIAPLASDDELNENKRLPVLVNSVSNEIGYSKGGCFLITGYRGVGKTSFINKVLQTTDQKLSEETIILPVRLSLARGYSTNKLLRRLIRELFYALTKSDVYKNLDATTRKQIDIAFLRTSHQVKTALAQGLKHAITHSESETHRDSITSKIGVERLTGVLASFEGKKEIEKSKNISRTEEKTSELGIELEFLEYDDEIAENDLSNLINVLHTAKVRVEKQSEIISSERPRRPEWVWKIISRLFSNIKLTVSFSETREVSTYKNIKLIFVLDEIDKMSFSDAEEIFRSLKNLFLQGNAFFFVITGKAFYYEWLRKRTSEDDIFFSIFTRILHIPLFSDIEFDQVAQQLSKHFPKNLLTHLKYKAKGTPREFFRELSRFVDWAQDEPKILVLDSTQTAIEISEKLYPVIQAQYAELESDERIDIGIRDHLRRSLHNWLEWMTILVTFTKSAVLQPKTEGETEDTLFSGRTRQTFEKMFASMLEEGILKDTGRKIDDQTVYTFTQEISDDLQEVDSTITGQLQDVAVEQQRLLNQITVDFYRLLEDGQLEDASNLLVQIREYSSQYPNQEYRKLYDRLQDELRVRKTVQQGDQLFAEKLFESALGAYEAASKHSLDFPGIREKIFRTQFAMAFDQADKADNYDAYLEARIRLNVAIRDSYESFETDIAQMKKEAKEKLNHVDKIIRTQDRLSESLKKGEARAAVKEYKKLEKTAPNLQALPEIREQLNDLVHAWDNLEGARQAMLDEDYEKAKEYARIAMASSNQGIAEEATEIFERIKSIASF